MKKRTFLGLLLILLCLFYGCVPGGKIKIDYGQSEQYSKEDMDAAIAVILDEFNRWDGCVMYKLSFAGDEVAKAEVGYCNQIENNQSFQEAIVFDTTFRSPIWSSKDDAWENNSIYDWHWSLARRPGEPWSLVTFGGG